MIDDKKIEAVAKAYMIGEFYDKDEAEWNYPITNEEKRNQCIIDFKSGAHWAINEFLKDVWHPASEEPKKVKNLLLETTYEYGKPIYHLIKYMPNGNNVCAWREWYKGAHISRWLYIDDLLPKEGGNHD